jgi:hypothetical protein
MSDPDQDALLRAWCADLSEVLGLEGLDVDIDSVLGLAGVAAHSVVRPAAPLTTFLAAYAAGLAAGRGEAVPEEAMRTAVARALDAAKARGKAGTEE